jgi:hypothetical protein
VEPGVWNYYGLERLAEETAIFIAPQGISGNWYNEGGSNYAFFDNSTALSRIHFASTPICASLSDSAGVVLLLSVLPAEIANSHFVPSLPLPLRGPLNVR